MAWTDVSYDVSNLYSLIHQEDQSTTIPYHSLRPTISLFTLYMEEANFGFYVLSTERSPISSKN